MPKLRVVAARIEREGRVLIAQRAAGKARAGTWEFPGGKVETGESDAGALEREIAEELGSPAAVVGPALAVVDHRYPELEIRLVLYPVALRGEPTARPEDHAALRWASAEELSKLPLSPADRALVEALAALPAP
jgi:8-oxo-dGTP diphosphatase